MREGIMGRRLLTTDPGEVAYSVHLYRPLQVKVKLRNTTDKTVIFKFKTNTPDKYSVRPSSGAIGPNSEGSVNITRQPLREVPKILVPKDKFLLQSVQLPEGYVAGEGQNDLFQPGKRMIHQAELKVRFIPPPAQFLAPWNGIAGIGEEEVVMAAPVKAAPQVAKKSGLSQVVEKVQEKEEEEEEEEEEDEEDERDEIDEVFYPRSSGPMRPEAGTAFVETGAPLPGDEMKRMTWLKKHQLLDSDAEEHFDRLTALAADIFKAEMCLVSLIDNKRQWFKSKTGLPACETDRQSSFCAYTLLPSKDPLLVVENALEDTRFSQNPLVTGWPHIRFYAGSPLLLSSGFILGSFCIISMSARKFTDTDRELLMSFSRIAVLDIEQRTEELDSQLEGEIPFSEGLLMVDCTKPNLPVVLSSKGWQELSGMSEEETLDKPLTGVLQQLIAQGKEAFEKRKSSWAQGQTGKSFQVIIKRKDGKQFAADVEVKPRLTPPGANYLRDAAITDRKFWFVRMSVRG
eukprot:TRINITY_DN655_c0_g2_i1.p1 TRINITY_DN655_c0_g2~~TRINITY_DN655_c0_g2_i1.p1  ORF type:complete len:515 (+),score=110.67 TRINITY_DN655_c0_g2_i1:127-1671(+)